MIESMMSLATLDYLLSSNTTVTDNAITKEDSKSPQTRTYFSKNQTE